MLALGPIGLVRPISLMSPIGPIRPIGLTQKIKPKIKTKK